MDNVKSELSSLINAGKALLSSKASFIGVVDNDEKVLIGVTSIPNVCSAGVIDAGEAPKVLNNSTNIFFNQNPF
jgi:hypothetical protein